ncbi:MAG: metal-dependent transcriptional regulator [Chloroflexi bacterium]|nr:metal-dependent transcriptional regulator [Chloroflexota bacterium]
MNEISPTPTVEDYLGVIYTLNRDGEPIIGAKLSELLEVSPPTVTVTLKRMIRDQWITMDARKEIHLTPKGIEAAVSIIRKHMLTEWMLSRILEIPWSQVHEEAHKIEHSISVDVADKMQERLDDPECCPHGNPLPGHEKITQNWKPLIEMEEGDRFIIRRVHEFAEEDGNLMDFLQKNKVQPDQIGIIKEKMPFNETISLQIEHSTIPLGFKIAKLLFVEKIDS